MKVNEISYIFYFDPTQSVFKATMNGVLKGFFTEIQVRFHFIIYF